MGRIKNVSAKENTLAGKCVMHQARTLVLDCRAAVERYSSEPNDESLPWQWLLIVSLLKSVAVVLHRADAVNSSPRLRRAICEKWHRLCSARPEPRIYWDFIDCEYDRILADYRGALVLGGGYLPVQRSEHGVACIRTELLLRDGVYAGCSSVRTALAALEWWSRYLDGIDSLAQSYE
jgi:hypothetical protein